MGGGIIAREDNIQIQHSHEKVPQGAIHRRPRNISVLVLLDFLAVICQQPSLGRPQSRIHRTHMSAWQVVEKAAECHLEVHGLSRS